MKYIQRIDSNGNTETVDEFEYRKEGLKLLKEYRLSDKSSYYYISQKTCKDWQEGYKEQSQWYKPKL